MELRKDPITRSWVIVGDEFSQLLPPPQAAECRFCPEAKNPPQTISTIQALDGHSWGARAAVHPSPIYRIEGEPARRGDGIYDRMRSVGAHEVLLENSRHDRHLWAASDQEIERFLLLVAQRIQDLKRDSRFKYVSVFKNFGGPAGQEFSHPNTQLTATTFVPRRVLYELRAARDYFKTKERCVFCDILAQETAANLRMIEVRNGFVALCPYAPRAPYETWLIPEAHDAAFERFALSRSASLRDLGALLRHTLERIRTITPDFHLVLHSAPNTLHRSESLGYWNTLDEDYHWHIEILPIVSARAKSYTFKEVYYSPVSSETAAKRLRDARVG
jgi:UDPglucose--hexose-1-phosphate uridylyltransferase